MLQAGFEAQATAPAVKPNGTGSATEWQPSASPQQVVDEPRSYAPQRLTHRPAQRLEQSDRTLMPVR